MIYNLEDLQKAHNAGQKFKFWFFWGHTPPSDGSVNQSCFSQWWMCRLTVKGKEYSCSEQFMMAEKARLFHDDSMLAQIMNAKNPKEMKAFGRAVRNFDNDIWQRNCYEIVKRGNLEKFSQNPELGQYHNNEKSDPCGSKSSRSHLGHWNGTEQSRCGESIEMAGQEPARLCVNRGAGWIVGERREIA